MVDSFGIILLLPTIVFTMFIIQQVSPYDSPAHQGDEDQQDQDFVLGKEISEHYGQQSQ